MTWTAHFRGGPLDGQALALPAEHPPDPYEVLVPAERRWWTGPDPFPAVRREYRLARYIVLHDQRVAFYEFTPLPAPQLPADPVVMHTMVGSPHSDWMTTGDEPSGSLQPSEAFAQEPWSYESLRESINRTWNSVVEAHSAFLDAFVQGGPADTWSEGTAADLCWRCDSAASQSDIGLCMDCRDDLKQETT